ncbi:hypothetical protein KR067_013288, partial [Drosophila pandora]
KPAHALQSAKAKPTPSPGLGRRSKLAAPKSRSAAVLLKRRSRRRRNDGGIDSAGGGVGVGGRAGAGAGGSGTGAGAGRNIHNAHSNGKEPCQFVPVRRKPLGEYMKLAPAPVCIPHPPVLTYAAAVEALPVPRYTGVKVIISPRLKRASKPGKSNQNKRPKKPQPTKPGNQFSIFAAEQPKPHIVHVDPKVFREEEKQPAKGKSKGKRNKKAKPKSDQRLPQNQPKPKAPAPKAKQKQRTAMNQTRTVASTSSIPAPKSAPKTPKPAPVPPTPEPMTSTQKPESPKEFSDSFSYLNYHHEKLQRILAIQTAGMRPAFAHVPRRTPLASPFGYAPEPASSSSNSTFRAAAPRPVQRYPIAFDDRQLKRSELEAAALLAQNKAMLNLWINPHLFIS